MGGGISTFKWNVHGRTKFFFPSRKGDLAQGESTYESIGIKAHPNTEKFKLIFPVLIYL
jgi:hypothetical protein